MAYDQGVQTYVRDFDFASAFITSAIVLLFMYLIWYRLNMKYFKKRLKNVGIDSTSVATTSLTPLTCNETSASVVNTKDAKESKISNIPPKINFCRNCGEKLIEGSLFCRNCGTRIKDTEQ